MAPKDLTVARRVIALRERLALSQQQFADKTGGVLERSYVAKIEIGDNKASSSKVRGALAQAAGVSLDAMVRYIDGAITLDALLSQPSAPPSHPIVAPDPALADRPSRPPPSDGSPLERALGDAFDPKRHTLGDTRAVEAALGATHRWERSEADLVAAARTWLDAAAALRREGELVTAVALLDRVTFGKTARARELGAEREARENAEGDDEAEALGLIRVEGAAPKKGK